MNSRLILPSLGLVLATAAGAQTQRSASASIDDARWYPWIGCWQRSGETGASARYTCVKPSSDGSADILTISNGAIESREHLVVDGAPHPIDRDGCRGSQTATWASSGNRVYIGAAYSCSSNMHGRSTRLFAILPSGVWLEVRNVHSGGGWVETITRFHDAGLPSSVPADVRSEISRRELAIATARAAASAPVSTSDIAEASRSVDTVVVQSWLAARGQAFAVDSVGPGGAPMTTPRVYAEPSPAQPQPAPRPEYSTSPTGCDAFGCYEPNGYSSYNGYVYSPYVQRYVYYGSPYYVPYLAPLIVVRGGSRGPTRAHPVGVRPPVHTPGGQRPARPGPVVQTPVNHAPPPAGHTPPRGMPSRIRP